MSKVADVLLIAMILFIPWVKLELRPGIGFTEILFVLLVGVVLIRIFVERWEFSAHVIREGFGVVIGIWLIAVLASGFNVPHTGSYLFEAGGMIYLGALSMVFATIAAWDEGRLQKITRWLIYSVIIVAAIGLIGIAKVIITKHYDLFFYSNAQKLIATFKYPNQLAGFLVLFLPLSWELLLSRRRKFGYGMLLIALLGALLASASRAGLAAVVFAAGVYLVWYVLKRNIKLVFSCVIFTLLAITSVYYLQFHIGAVARALDAINTTFSSGQITDPFRLENWSMGLWVFQRFPFTGYGLGNIARDFGYEVHNTYLSVLAEMGLVGAVSLIFLFGYIAFIGYQNVRLAVQASPAWLPYARGLFIGLLAEYVYATQHLVIRHRHLWLVFGLVVAMNGMLRIKRKARKFGRE